MLTLMIVLGTRPETIKLAPLIRTAKSRGHRVITVCTGQHRQLIDPLLKFFEITPDIDLAVMTAGQTLGSLSERILAQLNANLSGSDVDCLIVQGDTTTAFVAGYWAFLKRIPVAHVEAGLRTYDLDSPFPEEANRQLLSRIARFHFAPTLQSARALLDEGVGEMPGVVIKAVGNTGIDALEHVLRELRGRSLEGCGVDARIIQHIGDQPLVWVTAHRRESFGEGFNGICEGILRLAEANKEIRIVYPVHPNPQVREPVYRLLGGHPQIYLTEPQDYISCVALMSRASVLLTDSGGIQEEGPSLRKPIVVMRETTERPEGVTAGFARLVGTDPHRICSEALSALKNGLMSEAPNPYGDGKASERIVSTLAEAMNRMRETKNQTPTHVQVPQVPRVEHEVQVAETQLNA